MSRTTLHLSKQNFKFSAAHFLIFDAQKAERLHGHNYRVKVDLEFREGIAAKEKGYFVDFNVIKSTIRKSLELWDERILLPQEQKDMIFTSEGPSLKVNFRDRFYVFPKDEVVLLPTSNTSTEQFSKILAETWFPEFTSLGVAKLQVYVEETEGQGASTEISI